MMRRPEVRLIIAMGPTLALGTIAVALAENVEQTDWRFVLLFLAVGSVAASSWRIGAAALGGTMMRAHGLPNRLGTIARSERRGPTTNTDTGLHTDWYFRLRVEEEIGRAKRYQQPFTVIGVRSLSPETLDVVRAVTADSLREVDFAGDLGQQVAVCLPNTSRSGAWNVVTRLTAAAKGVDIKLLEFPADGSTLASLLGDGRVGMGAISDYAA